MKRKKSTEEFIQELINIHGDLYGYDKINYINSKEDVILTCRVHGDFTIRPNNYLNSKTYTGCPYCSPAALESFNKFKRRCKALGLDYDFSKSRYLNLNTLIEFITEDGTSKVDTPKNILKYRSVKLKSHQDFVKFSNIVHEDRYTYLDFEYKNTSSLAKIICPVHGVFEQPVYSHISGSGCNLCFGNIRYTQEEALKELKKVRPEYDFTNTVYTSFNAKIHYTCDKGHSCYKAFSCVIKGVGCAKCSGNSPLTTQECISKFKEVHQDKYDYSSFTYTRSNKKSIIICREHGEFYQTPNKHLQGRGCPACRWSISRSEAEIELCDWFRHIKGLEVVETFRPEWLLIGSPHSKEIDIYIPSLKLGIEYNGAFWHSIEQESYNLDRHLKKYEICKSNGIDLVFIWDIEDIVKWKKKLSNYIDSKDRYSVHFENIKRTVKEGLTIYGKSSIILKKL